MNSFYKKSTNQKDIVPTTAKVSDHCQRIDHQPNHVIPTQQGYCGEWLTGLSAQLESLPVRREKLFTPSPVIASGRVGVAKGSEAICTLEAQKLQNNFLASLKEITIPCSTRFLSSLPNAKTFAITVVAFFLLFGAGQLLAQVSSYIIKNSNNG